MVAYRGYIGLHVQVQTTNINKRFRSSYLKSCGFVLIVIIMTQEGHNFVHVTAQLVACVKCLPDWIIIICVRTTRTFTRFER